MMVDETRYCGMRLATRRPSGVWPRKSESPRGFEMTELIGWGSAAITLPTFGLQTYKQWRGRHEEVPASTVWFFILAMLGSSGQVVYSWLLDNWVFLAVNVCLIANNLVGL